MRFLMEQIVNGNKLTLEVISEIDEAEVEKLHGCFAFTSSLSIAKMAMNIALKNGQVFMYHMLPDNLSKYRSGAEAENAVIISNQYALNYATSLKSFIDITERQLRKTKEDKELNDYKAVQRQLYDSCLEYRFWMRMRNYVVHCGFPYTQSINTEKGLSILCSKNRLLEYNKWNQVKQDIEKMGEYVELEKMVDKANVCLTALRLTYTSLHAKDIIKAIEMYGEFCRKYSVKHPVLAYTERFEDFANGKFKANPLPVNILFEAFEELKSNPHVKLHIQ